MTTQGSAAAVARENARNKTDGRFGEQAKLDPGTTVLAGDAPLSEADKEKLAPFAGMAVRGYDSYDLARLKAAMPAGYQLRSNAGRIYDLEARVGDGPWRPISDQLVTFLVAGEPGSLVPDQPLFAEPQPHFGLSEKDWLNENAGVFALGYGESMIDGMASSLPSMQVACVWDEFDQHGFGGDSQLYGRVGDGPWRPFSDELNSYLIDGQPGDDLPNVFLGEPDGLELNLDTVLAMNAHNYRLRTEG